MVGVNCLFNYDGINYRLNINTKIEKEVITFDELKKNLRDHPKLKEVDFFDTEKYVVEIFDKGFDDYVKLPRDVDICDYSKLRARLRPKSTLTLVRKEEESRKRPLGMYAEINMEEEHAAKILRGSPPPSSTHRMRASSPPSSSSFRRSHSGVSEPSRSENFARQNTSVKTPATPKPSPVQTPSFKQKITPKPSPTSRPPPPPPPPPQQQQQQASSKTPISTKTAAVSKTPDTPTNPFSSSNSNTSNSKISSNSNTPRASHVNIGNNIPPGVDQDSYLLAKAVVKYNDEFANIMMFDEIWETDHVWPFVFREISGQGVKSIKDVRETRNTFKSLVDKYIAILKKTHLTEAAANESWPLFDIFHSKLNMKLFYGGLKVLKEAFDNGEKVSIPSSISIQSPSSSSQPSTTSAADVPTPSSSSEQQQKLAPKPQRIQVKAPSEDIILLSSDETEKPTIKIDEDPEIEEVHLDTSPPRPTTPPQLIASSLSPQTSPPKTEPESPMSIVVTSDDFRLLLAVEDHNKEFYGDVVPENSAWREVTDQINLYQPFEPSLVMKYKTRFYELLQEFIRIENSSIPVSEKAKWKLYSTFNNIDTEPFLSKLKQ